MFTLKRLKLSDPREVRRALTRIANMVLNDQLDSKKANTLVYVCNAVLASIRIDEQEKKLDELERLIMEMRDV